MQCKLVPSICSYCGTGCGVLFEVIDGKIVSTLPMKTHPVNEGKLCIKGWNLHEHVNSFLRLKQPLIKAFGRFIKADWDAAIQLAADGFREIIEKHGPDAVGILVSAKITNEENYLAQKFARAVIGTNNVDHCARLWHSSTVAGLAAAFGSGAMTNSIAEIEDSGCIFVIGSNTTACHPLIARRIFRAKERGAKLIVADPRNIQLSRFADVAVNQRLGSDVALLNGMMHIIIENGWHVKDYIAQRTENYETLEKMVSVYTPQKVQDITGVDPKHLERMAELYATHPPASLLYAMGITQHTTGVDNVKSCCNLAMLCGNVGVRGGGVNPLRGQNNVQGACDMGGLPNVMTGYQPVADPKVREKFSAAWGKPLSEVTGLTITDMIPAMLEGKLKGLYVIGENPKLSDPDWNHLSHALKELDFLVVQELFLSETAQVADVVFSAASVAEKEGTVTNTERRCMRIHQAIDPIGNTLADWEIICRLSTAMGYEMNYENPQEIFNEMASLTPKSYAGMTYERLGLDGLQWPCPDSDHPGTPYLHKEQFARGKGKFHAVDYHDPAEMPDDQYPYFLTTGRMFAHFHTGTMTRISPHLDVEQTTGYVTINPQDAEALAVQEGDVLVLSSRRGRMEAPAQISPAVEPGTAFLPIHFGENPPNVLTSAEAVDPLAKIPEFKVSAVNIEKLSA